VVRRFLLPARGGSRFGSDAINDNRICVSSWRELPGEAFVRFLLRTRWRRRYERLSSLAKDDVIAGLAGSKHLDTFLCRIKVLCTLNPHNAPVWQFPQNIEPVAHRHQSDDKDIRGRAINANVRAKAFASQGNSPLAQPPKHSAFHACATGSVGLWRNQNSDDLFLARLANSLAQLAVPLQCNTVALAARMPGIRIVVDIRQQED